MGVQPEGRWFRICWPPGKATGGKAFLTEPKTLSVKYNALQRLASPTRKNHQRTRHRGDFEMLPAHLRKAVYSFAKINRLDRQSNPHMRGDLDHGPDLLSCGSRNETSCSWLQAAVLECGSLLPLSRAAASRRTPKRLWLQVFGADLLDLCPDLQPLASIDPLQLRKSGRPPGQKRSHHFTGATRAFWIQRITLAMGPGYERMPPAGRRARRARTPALPVKLLEASSPLPSPQSVSRVRQRAFRAARVRSQISSGAPVAATVTSRPRRS